MDKATKYLIWTRKTDFETELETVTSQIEQLNAYKTVLEDEIKKMEGFE